MMNELVRVLPEAGGTAASFDDLYRLQYLAVLRVVTAVTGDSEAAAELTQEAFIAAHRKWNAVSQFDRPDLWVRRVAINRALSFRRRAGREARYLGRLAAGRERHVALPGTDDELWAAVRRLPRQQATVVALVYVDDMTVEQAADAMDIAVPTAKTHLQRARRTLALRLNEETDQ